MDGKKVSNETFLYDAMITIVADNKSQINSMEMNVVVLVQHMIFIFLSRCRQFRMGFLSNQA